MKHHQCQECHLFVKVLFSNRVENNQSGDHWYECPKCLKETIAKKEQGLLPHITIGRN